MTKERRGTVRDKPVDVCFVLDATRSTQSVFRGMIDQVNNLAFDLKTNNRRANFLYGAVIYRDPVDYRPPPPSEDMDEDMKREFEEFEAKQKQERIDRLKAAHLYDEEFEREKEEYAKHIDRVAFPVDQNVPIPFTNNIENLIDELMKVECDGGNDEPEDWVGALEIALDNLEWRENSKRCLVWISDANAHGKRFCGFDNHNEEEPKMEPLIRRLVENRFYFVGINVVKSEKDTGCQKTLQEMRSIYQDICTEIYTDPAVHPPKFIIDEFKPVYNEDLYGEDEWPADVLETFMQTIQRTLAKLDGDLFT